MSIQISRREMLKFLGIGVPATLLTMGCPAVAPVIARVAVSSLSRTFWGAVRTRPILAAARTSSITKQIGKRLTVKALIEAGEWYISPKISSSDMGRLQGENAPLILKDERGSEFNTPYAIFEDLGVIQSCYRDEPRYLYEEPNFNSRQMSWLEIGEEVGVFDLTFTSKGWYKVQTTNRQIGWIHGNCLEPLPLSKYYA